MNSRTPYNSNSHEIRRPNPFGSKISDDRQSQASRFKAVRTWASLRCSMLSVGLILIGGNHFGATGIQADEPRSTKLLPRFLDELVAIKPGEGSFPDTFEMGCDDSDLNERPSLVVTMPRSFWMSKYETPQNLYEFVMGKNPSRWKGQRNSVEMVSWDDANEFCSKLTDLLHEEELIPKNEIIRLPSEAEWEYCCRAGTTTRYSFGDNPQKSEDIAPVASVLDRYGWHKGNAEGHDPTVGRLKPNPWGLYDMHGYLWELTSDIWTINHKEAPADGNAQKATHESISVAMRGGSWKDLFPRLTSSARQRFNRTQKDDAVGFRCVRARRLK